MSPPTLPAIPAHAATSSGSISSNNVFTYVGGAESIPAPEVVKTPKATKLLKRALKRVKQRPAPQVQARNIEVLVTKRLMDGSVQEAVVKLNGARDFDRYMEQALALLEDGTGNSAVKVTWKSCGSAPLARALVVDGDPMVDDEQINFTRAVEAMKGAETADEPEWPTGTGPFGF